MISKIVKVRTHGHLFYGDTGIRTLLKGWKLGTVGKWDIRTAKILRHPPFLRRKSGRVSRP